MTMESLLAWFEEAAANPRAQLNEYMAQGRKVVGCMPVYCPEELVEAAGMVPFGVWGANMEIAEAKKYFPAFYCSIAQTTLEMGLRGGLDGLSAMMIPVLCDTLKCMGQNWKAAVPDVPFIPVTHPQNRKMEAGVAFLASQYRKIAKELEAVGGAPITPESLRDAIKAHNAHRALMRDFAALCADRPGLISPTRRSAVIKSSFFMAKAEHGDLVAQLLAACRQEPEAPWEGRKILVTGIYADIPDVLRVFEDNKLAVVADEVAHESRQFRTDVPDADDPFEALARHLSVMEGCSVLYDPDKLRAQMIVDEARKSGADGVVFLLAKFCDPEEFDYPIVKKALDGAGIPSIMTEVDQQMRNYEQARTAIQTFADVLGR